MVIFEIKEVKLYKMGVGWLSAQARCKEKDILFPVLKKQTDDFLKTFHVDIEGESLLSSISFDSETKGEIEIEQSGCALTSILDLLSGSRIQINLLNGEKYEGRLVGYQESESENKDDGAEITIVLSSPDNLIKQVASKEIESIFPAEEYFRKSLNDQLDLLSKSKKEDVKNIKISFTDESEKDIVVSYLTELPAWQSSYRIYSIGEEKAVFELWALVSNNTQIDWIDAQVQLLTGLPISFKYDMSSPWLIDRPYVSRPTQTGISVMKPEAEFEPRPSPKLAPMAAPKRAKRAVAKMDFVGAAAIEEPYEYEETAEQEAEIVTTTESVTFSLKQLVTIKKGESALLLLHSTDVPKEKIYIYNRANHASHPFGAIEIENKSGYAWEEGPVTIYEKGDYSGEAMLQRVPKDEKQIIPHRLEQDIYIKQSEESSTKLVNISLSGYYYVESFINKTEYLFEIENKADEEKQIILETPKLYGYEVDKKKSKIEVKETPNYFRAKIKIEEKSSLKAKIHTFRKTSQSVSIASVSDQVLEELLDLETIDEKQGTIIKKIRDLRTEKQKLVVQRDSEEKSIKRMESEYQNITKSIQVLRSEGEEGKTRAKYVTKMNDLFEKMETKRKSIETIDIKVEKISKTILKEIDKL